MALKGMFRRSVAATTLCDGETPSTSTTAMGLLEKLALPTHEVQPKDPTFGAKPTIKTFYKNERKGWVETPPKQLSKKVSTSYDGVAIKIYKVGDPEQPTIAGHTPLRIETIEVQSPVLVSALKDVLEPIGTFLEAQETAKFERPFKPLFFRYDNIMALYEMGKDGTVLKEHLHVLTKLMVEVFGGLMARLRNLRESKLITYDVAWTYLPRGSAIYCGAQDCERLFRVLDTEYDCDKHVMMVACQDIAFNGSKFEWETVILEIPEFAGNVPITSIPNYPLEFHEDAEKLKGRMITRAKLVLDYQDLEYREYTGTGNSEDPAVKRHNVSGRILVDFFGYEKHFKGLKRQSQSEEPKSTYIKTLNEEKQKENKNTMLARSQDLIFVSPMLSGFALKDKLWLRFYVDEIRPVVWNDEAYEHLVYPEEQKDLVLTFVEKHRRIRGELTDVIKGKGQGLVTLLSGPPGTGKTLLAEAVADKTRRPLYYLQAEELGTNAQTLGKNLKKVFEMATEWNAVILLDEADVFMAERSPSDVLRNELVSIFLRELEYYRGIIFLTTNLLATIDNAFRSRVNIHLIFTSLSHSSRVMLWRKTLARVPDAGAWSVADVDQLAAWDLNGREIKNAIGTVRTWCACKGYRIDLQRLESAIVVTAPQAKKGGGPLTSG